MFLRLPPAAAVLLLSTVLGGLADGHALLPRQTKTIEPHELNVIMWPPLPTAAPLLSPMELFRRQADNTICGYLGGDSALPATCSAGSHCVLDEANKVMGCCPNAGSCTTGVFTGCVDQNSGPQTEVNPYVYTCAGRNVCYKNSFPGGFFQYGCGTASNLATSVQTGASGKPTLPLVQTSIALTKSASSLSESTSRLSSSSSKSSSSSSSATTTPASSSGTPTSSGAPADTANTTPAAPPASQNSGPGYNRTGAIVGGTIGGLALLAALLALLFCCLRRRRNRRRGPGPAPVPVPTSEYPSPRSHGAAFAPLPTWQEEEEPQTTPPTHHAQPYSHYEHPALAGAAGAAGAGKMRHVADDHDHGYGHGHGNGYGGPAPVSAVSGPSPNTPIGGNGNGGWPLAYGGGQGQTPIANEYLNNYPSSNNYHNGSGAGAVVTPLTPYHSNNPHAFSNNWSQHPAHDGMYNNSTAHNNGPSREIDDFSRDVGATMRHVQDDEDTEPLTAGSSMHNYPIDGAGGGAGVGGGAGGGHNNTHLQPYQQHPSAPGSSGSMTSMSSYTPSRRGDRPLWQQTRRQSRNLMWL
ncbi:hypothetical protein PG991_006163 [Apiospora marii]|uniref:Uncharacterized protein n=1 Tax=Apiospora marii TaxID=335849 RepID=A0ABR1SB85_9PEZI